MPFPEAELSYGGTYAFIITLNNQLRIVQVRPIYGRVFYVPELGVYQLHEEYRYICGRSEVYFYNQKGTNPLSLAALHDIMQMLDKHGRTELEMADLALLVDKIRRVEVTKQLIHTLRTQSKEEPITDDELRGMLMDGSLEHTAERISIMNKPLTYAGLDKRTIMWLNSYFREDTISRFYLNLRMITDDKYKLPQSGSVHNIIPIQKTTGKKDIGLIILNNARIIVDANVKVEMDHDKGHYVMHTKDFGDFDIVEAKTRYKYGRQNIFVAMVQTIKDRVVTTEDGEDFLPPTAQVSKQTIAMTTVPEMPARPAAATKKGVVS